MSGNAGGLLIWPAKLLIPLGFFLLFLQGISELIKRIAVMRGRYRRPARRRADAHRAGLALEMSGLPLDRGA